MSRRERLRSAERRDRDRRERVGQLSILLTAVATESAASLLKEPTRVFHSTLGGNWM